MNSSRFMQFAALLNSAQGSINRMKRQNMEAFDLGPAHTMCLNLLYQYPDGITKARLAELCEVDKAQISRVVSELQKKELIATPDLDKRYKHKLSLTSHGNEVSEQISRIILDINSFVSDSIPQEQIDTFYKTFNMICENLKKAEKNFSIYTEEKK